MNSRYPTRDSRNKPVLFPLGLTITAMTGAPSGVDWSSLSWQGPESVGRAVRFWSSDGLRLGLAELAPGGFVLSADGKSATLSFAQGEIGGGAIGPLVNWGDALSQSELAHWQNL